MKCNSPCKMALLATQIAIELAKGKDIDEINLIKNMTAQICSALQVIISQEVINKKDNCPKC